MRKKQYVLKGFKTRGGQVELDPFITEYDEDIVQARTKEFASLPFTHALTLIPVPSVDVETMHYKVRLFIDRINRLKKKLTDSSQVKSFKGTTPYYSLIEFGEQYGGIHAHVLLASPLSARILEEQWNQINGDDRRQLAVVRILETVTAKHEMIRYYTIMEEVYSAISHKYGTDHINHLCIHNYKKIFDQHKHTETK